MFASVPVSSLSSCGSRCFFLRDVVTFAAFLSAVWRSGALEERLAPVPNTALCPHGAGITTANWQPLFKLHKQLNPWLPFWHWWWALNRPGKAKLSLQKAPRVGGALNPFFQKKKKQFKQGMSFKFSYWYFFRYKTKRIELLGWGS